MGGRGGAGFLELLALRSLSPREEPAAPEQLVLRRLLSGSSSSSSLSELLEGAAADGGALLRLLAPLSAAHSPGRALGRGGFGTVVSAVESWAGREVALKRVSFCAPHPPWAPAEQLAAAHEPLLREARVLGTLHHPNVVRLHSAWVEPLWERLLQSSGGTEPQLLLGCCAGARSGSVGGSASGWSASESGWSGTLGASEASLPLVPLAPLTSTAAGPLAVPTPRLWPYRLSLSMELVDGPSLAAYLSARCDDGCAFDQAGRLSPAAAAAAAAIARQVASGLAHCHSRGVIHRDLKPGNVVLSWPAAGGLPRAVIIDLGLATLRVRDPATVIWPEASDEDEAGPHTGGVGTAGYAAPEQAAAHGAYSAAADIFSLGLVLLELLTPWRTQQERVALLAGARAGAPPPPQMEAVLAGSAALAAACCRIEAAARPSAAAVAAAPALRRRREGRAKAKRSLPALTREVAALKAQLAQREAELGELRAAATEAGAEP